MIILKNYPLIKEIFNTMPVGIVILDEDAKILYASKMVEEIAGIEASLLLNKKAESQFQGLDMAAVTKGTFNGKLKTKTASFKATCQAFQKYRILYLS